MPTSAVQLVFPHQLFDAHLSATPSTTFVLIEDDLFFRQYRFHKQKLILHRASLQSLRAALEEKGFSVHYIESSPIETSLDQLLTLLKKLEPEGVLYYDVVDDWLQQRLDTVFRAAKISPERLVTPSFLTSPGLIADYFDTNPNRMRHFYEWQRRRLNILVDDTGHPVGGKWSFDKVNRKKLPKTVELPSAYRHSANKYIDEAKKWVAERFSSNPGNGSDFYYPIDHHDARQRLATFLSERLVSFGPYEDAISGRGPELFHSVLSPLLNNGLLTPNEVVENTLSFVQTHDVPIESLEGFIRQVIGWREYIRATYVKFGRRMRTENHLQATRHLASAWWDGSTGLTPVDDVITKVLNTSYAHHIERLMILGNSMVLLRIHPDDVYEWFMSLFIDAYDWVMVPNVYAMSQFAAGTMITTKPYISGSNYIIKMSDYKKDAWAEPWDALYWRFINDHRDMMSRNPRSSMMVSLYDRLSDTKKDTVETVSSKWLS